jgi:hypothetical protein
MSLHTLAQQLAARGRGGDSTLVHMTPGEVGGLQAIALAHGGSLTTNPDTGLPEANFLKSILPMLAGGALSVMSGGALSPLMAAGIVGGGTALATRNLGQGLMAGLGAFGGAGLGSALASMGAAAPGAAAQTLSEAAQSSALPLTGNPLLTPAAPYASGLAQGVMPAAQGTVSPLVDQAMSGIARGLPAPSASTMGAGFTAAMQNPQALVSQLGGGRAALQTAGMAMAPMLAGAGQGAMQEDPDRNPHPMLAPASFGYARRPASSLDAVPSGRRQFAEGGLAALRDNPYYTMSGDSAEAYEYLMGQRPSGRSAQEIEAGKIPHPTTVTGPQYEGLPNFTLDTLTRQMTPAEPQTPQTPQAATPDPRMGGREYYLQELDTGSAGGGFAAGGRLLAGPGDGVSDSIPATIDNKTPARLATGEFVFDARTVSEIGNGDTKSGAKKLYAVMDAIHRKRARAERGKPSGADQHLRELMA